MRVNQSSDNRQYQRSHENWEDETVLMVKVVVRLFVVIVDQSPKRWATRRRLPRRTFLFGNVPYLMVQCRCLDAPQVNTVVVNIYNNQHPAFILEKLEDSVPEGKSIEHTSPTWTLSPARVVRIWP